jgi:hypothetical protein
MKPSSGFKISRRLGCDSNPKPDLLADIASIQVQAGPVLCSQMIVDEKCS